MLITSLTIKRSSRCVEAINWVTQITYTPRIVLNHNYSGTYNSKYRHKIELASIDIGRNFEIEIDRGSLIIFQRLLKHNR